jgi:hypothetical protein
VHRTFQDFLGAKAFVENLDFGVLDRHAHEDQWEDVIRMAVAHARPHERDDMLMRLLYEHEPRLLAIGEARRVLIAAACLEQATKLHNPDVLDQVRARTNEFLPPRAAQTQWIASLGPIVLSLLTGPDQLANEEQAMNVVITASLIRTDAAIAVLSRFREHSSMPLRTHLAWSWDKFDTRLYADEIIAHLPREGVFAASDVEQLQILRDLGGRAHIHYLETYEPDDLTENINAEVLTRLGLQTGYRTMRGRRWLYAFPKLGTLILPQQPDDDLRGSIPDQVRIVIQPPSSATPVF